MTAEKTRILTKTAEKLELHLRGMIKTRILTKDHEQIHIVSKGAQNREFRQKTAKNENFVKPHKRQ